jgi:hypothetical protein
MEEDIWKTMRKVRDTEETAKKAENTGTWNPEEGSTVMRGCTMNFMNTCISMVGAIMKNIAAGMNSTTDAMEDIR